MWTNLTDAEDGVLGVMLTSNADAIEDLGISGDDFSDPHKGDLFDLMRRMKALGESVTPATVAEKPKVDAAKLFALTDHAGFSYALFEHAEIVAAHGMRAKLRQAAASLANPPEGMSASEMTEYARSAVDAAVGQEKSRVRFVRDIVPEVIDRLQRKESFVPTPWPTLNAAIGGLRPGAVYVVAARPGVGKTVIAAQLAACLAQHGMVAFSSLEMTQDELVSRLISERLLIGVGKIKDARMTDRDWQILADRRHELDGLNVAIDDRSGVAPGDIRNFARSVSRHGKLAGIVVDYMQLMTSRDKAERWVQVSEFSRQLKIMAKDLQVPVVALSQLNRQSESRMDGVPKLSDLRESGAIEQDADVVILLRREGEDPNPSLILDVAKNRHGETGEVDLAWQGMFSRAVEWKES